MKIKGALSHAHIFSIPYTLRFDSLKFRGEKVFP